MCGAVSAPVPINFCKPLPAVRDYRPFKATFMSQNLKFILIRHHLSQANIAKELTASRAFYRDRDDAKIELYGSAEALRRRELFKAAMRARYANAGPMRIIHTPTTRTDRTAADFASVLQPGSFTIEADAAFGEKKFGDWNGLDDDARQNSDPLLFAAYMYNDMSPAEQKGTWHKLNRQFEGKLGKFWIAPPGGESEEMVQQRAIARLRELARETRDETIVVVAHSVTLRVTIGALEHINPHKIAYEPRPQNSSVYVWSGDFAGGRFRGTGKEVFAGFPVLAEAAPALAPEGVPQTSASLSGKRRSWLSDLMRPAFPRPRTLAR
jgi:broad specificity phosphatase PhoE